MMHEAMRQAARREVEAIERARAAWLEIHPGGPEVLRDLSVLANGHDATRRASGP